jgi:hypothetical protein
MGIRGRRGKSGLNGGGFCVKRLTAGLVVPIFQTQFRKISIFDWPAKSQAGEFRKNAMLPRANLVARIDISGTGNGLERPGRATESNKSTCGSIDLSAGCGTGIPFHIRVPVALDLHQWAGGQSNLK